MITSHRVSSSTTAGLPGRCCRFQCNQRSANAAHAAAVQVAGSDSGATASGTTSVSTAAGATTACAARAEVAGGVLPYDLSIVTASCEVVNASVVFSDSAAAADVSTVEEAGGALDSAGRGGLAPAPRCTFCQKQRDTRGRIEQNRNVVDGDTSHTQSCRDRHEGSWAADSSGRSSPGGLSGRACGRGRRGSRAAVS